MSGAPPQAADRHTLLHGEAQVFPREESSCSCQSGRCAPGPDCCLLPGYSSKNLRLKPRGMLEEQQTLAAGSANERKLLPFSYSASGNASGTR